MNKSILFLFILTSILLENPQKYKEILNLLKNIGCLYRKSNCTFTNFLKEISRVVFKKVLRVVKIIAPAMKIRSDQKTHSMELDGT